MKASLRLPSGTEQGQTPQTQLGARPEDMRSATNIPLGLEMRA